MTKFRTAAAILMITASYAHAAGFEGATLDVNHTSYSNGSLGADTTDVGGMVNFGVSSGFGVQLDFDGLKTSAHDMTNAGLHGYYDFGNGFASGLFFTRSTTYVPSGNSHFDSFGIEGLYSGNAVTVQGYFGKMRPVEGYINADIYLSGLKVTYDVGSVSSLGDLSLYGKADFLQIRMHGTDPDLSGQTIGLGGRFDFGNGAFADLSISRLQVTSVLPGNEIRFTIGYDIGGGAKFDRRSLYAAGLSG